MEIKTRLTKRNKINQWKAGKMQKTTSNPNSASSIKCFVMKGSQISLKFHTLISLTTKSSFYAKIQHWLHHNKGLRLLKGAEYSIAITPEDKKSLLLTNNWEMIISFGAGMNQRISCLVFDFRVTKENLSHWGLYWCSTVVMEKCDISKIKIKNKKNYKYILYMLQECLILWRY